MWGALLGTATEGMFSDSGGPAALNSGQSDVGRGDGPRVNVQTGQGNRMSASSPAGAAIPASLTAPSVGGLPPVMLLAALGLLGVILLNKL